MKRKQMYIMKDFAIWNLNILRVCDVLLTTRLRSRPGRPDCILYYTTIRVGGGGGLSSNETFCVPRPKYFDVLLTPPHPRPRPSVSYCII